MQNTFSKIKLKIKNVDKITKLFVSFAIMVIVAVLVVIAIQSFNTVEYETVIYNKNNSAVSINNNNKLMLSNNLYSDNEVDIDYQLFKIAKLSNEFFYPNEIATTISNDNTFEIYKKNIGENNNVNAIKVVGECYNNYEVTEDGKYVVYFNNPSTLSIYDLSTSSTKEIDTDITSYDLKISKNDKYVLYTKGDKKPLYAYDIAKDKSTKIDDNVKDILTIDDNFDKIYYTKEGKKVGVQKTVDLYVGSVKRKSSKIATQIIQDQLYINEKSIIYKIPVLNVDNLKDKAIKFGDFTDDELEKIEDTVNLYYNKNFYDLYEMDTTNYKSAIVDDNIKNINYVTSDEEYIIYEKINKLKSEKISSTAELFSKITFSNVLIDSVGDKYYLDENSLESKKDTNETTINNYGYDEKTKQLYYVSNDKKLKKYNILNFELVFELIADNVNRLSYINNNLYYLTNANELYFYNNKNILVDNNVTSFDSYSNENVVLYNKKSDDKLYSFNGKDSSYVFNNSVIDAFPMNGYVYFCDAKTLDLLKVKYGKANAKVIENEVDGYIIIK